MRRFLIALSCALLSAACIDTTAIHTVNKTKWVMPSKEVSDAIYENCNESPTCAFPKWLAKLGDLNEGRNMGSGAVLRDITANGRQALISWDISRDTTKIADANGVPVSKESYEAFLVDYLKNNHCRTPFGRSFFAAGGILVLESYLPSGERYSRCTAKSC
ncbi:MAG: hypothetical protein ACU0BK_17025 [Shimia sp.]|uniref:hypothetical protein n=1 Tax=Shimia sp. TaxID=1954381 RepID=UPI00405A2868